PQDSLPGCPMMVQVVAEDTSGTACFGGSSHTIAIWLHNADSGRSGCTQTSLDFYWRDCPDNILWQNGHDTIMAARRVFDGTGDDITGEDGSLPGFCGPDSFCLDPVVYNAHAVIRGIRFESGSVEFTPPTDVDDMADEYQLPTSVRLKQNYPNPFNPGTTIEFHLPATGRWRIDIMNIRGQVVRRLTGNSAAGVVTVPWDGRDEYGHEAASGVYFYRLSAGGRHESRKMLLVK
ncbi:MAG: T9SS type A sorting domain-containing protein, partial [Candidatus Zixiibacteriota bacterium]